MILVGEFFWVVSDGRGKIFKSGNWVIWTVKLSRRFRIIIYGRGCWLMFCVHIIIIFSWLIVVIILWEYSLILIIIFACMYFSNFLFFGVVVALEALYHCSGYWDLQLVPSFAEYIIDKFYYVQFYARWRWVIVLYIWLLRMICCCCYWSCYFGLLALLALYSFQ